jgi:D-threo-aldose 1-dehydrogenase
MIAKVTLPTTGLSISRLAFGTSRLHHMRAGGRQRILAAAADAGFSHFDTAPAYGDGLAETELGRFVRGRRDRLTIATKYGIPPNRVIAAFPPLALPVRAARAVARRAFRLPTTLPPLTPQGLRLSVEASLRRLGTDHVDMLLLHEPHPGRIPHPDELLVELQRLVTGGAVRHLGLAGEWKGVAASAARLPGLAQILQAPESQWSGERAPDLTFGALSGGAQSYFAGKVDGGAAAGRLREALRRRPNGAVVVSTTQPGNLGLLADAAANI